MVIKKSGDPFAVSFLAKIDEQSVEAVGDGDPASRRYGLKPPPPADSAGISLL